MMRNFDISLLWCKVFVIFFIILGIVDLALAVSSLTNNHITLGLFSLFGAASCWLIVNLAMKKNK